MQRLAVDAEQFSLGKTRRGACAQIAEERNGVDEIRGGQIQFTRASQATGLVPGCRTDR